MGPWPLEKWPREEMGMAGAWLGSAGIQPALAAYVRGRAKEPVAGAQSTGCASLSEARWWI
jgi:hypothetical protein